MFIPLRRTTATEFNTPPPGINQQTFLGLLWTFTALSLFAVTLRLTARFRGSRRLYLDDVFVIVSEILILSSTSLWQWGATAMYYVLNVRSGLQLPGRELFPDLRIFLDVQLFNHLAFYTILILVKLAFLFFFKRLGANVQNQKYIWWPVLGFSLATYFISVGNIQYKCYTSSLDFVLTFCPGKENNNFIMDTMKANMALDVVSDFMIMLIPVTLLWNVQLPKAKKLACFGLFSLSIITIVIAIVRAIQVDSSRFGSGGQDDPTFLWLWSAIQSSLAIIISCLSAFPQLFSGQAKKKPVWSPTDTYYQRMRSKLKQSNKKQNTLYDISTTTVSGDHELESKTSHFSMTNPQPTALPKAALPQSTASGLYGDSDEFAVVPLNNHLSRHESHENDAIYQFVPQGTQIVQQLLPLGSQLTPQLNYHFTQQQQPQFVITAFVTPYSDYSQAHQGQAHQSLAVPCHAYQQQPHEPLQPMYSGVNPHHEQQAQAPQQYATSSNMYQQQPHELTSQTYVTVSNSVNQQQYEQRNCSQAE